MERLNSLRREFEQTIRLLEFPFSFEDFDQLKERRDAIRREARALATKLNLAGPFWFDTTGWCAPKTDILKHVQYCTDSIESGFYAHPGNESSQKQCHRGSAMNMPKYPAWQKPYEAAVKEDYPQNLTKLIDEAESATFERMLALSSSPDGHQELQAVRDACRRLLVIKTEKLKWPNPFAGSKHSYE
jgi:hypothetical protein